MKKCHACGEPWDGAPGTQPGREESCVKCGASLHCCLNCRFYEPSAHHECRSSTTEYVRDKESKNFCDEFELNHKGGTGEGRESAQGDMNQKWNDLFK